MPRHLSEKLRGVWQHAHIMPCPREIQSIMQPHANVCVPMQSKLKVCANAWLDRSMNTKIMSVPSDRVHGGERGTSLAYEQRLLPCYISKQQIHCCLAEKL